MSPFENKTSKLPFGVSELVTRFQDQLSAILGRNLVGTYLFGSVAFPDYDTHSGDIDFYAVVRKRLTKTEMDQLDSMHRSISEEFEYGSRLEGFYILIAQARKSQGPKGLIYASHRRIHRGGVDDAWSLHREHFHSSAYIRLHGPSPSTIFRTADWPSIREDLFRQLVYARRIIQSDPWWAVLNLCRLVYTFEKGKIVVSKLGAAKWALTKLPRKWHQVIRAAVNAYKGPTRGRDRIILRRDASKFLGFASVRILAFDSTWNLRKPHITHLRKKTKVGGR